MAPERREPTAPPADLRPQVARATDETGANPSARERAEHAYDAWAERVDTSVTAALDRMPAEVKPKLRGWLHMVTAPIALLGTIALLLVAQGSSAEWAVAIYGLTSIMLFGVSAAYHAGTWTPRVKEAFKVWDHANITLIIAGTYTPFAVLLLDGWQQTFMLVVVWGGALVGPVVRATKINTPRWVYTLGYIGLGWTAVAFIGDLARAGGWLVVSLIALGGILYTVGGVVYATKRPDPSPRWFGFHEVFHAFTIAAWLCHYAAIMIVVVRAG